MGRSPTDAVDQPQVRQPPRSTRPAGGALSRSKQPNSLAITPIGYVLFDERAIVVAVFLDSVKISGLRDESA